MRTTTTMKRSLCIAAPEPSFLVTEESRISTGDIVFIPKGEWHGFENDAAADTLLVWAISSSQYLHLHRLFFSGKPTPPPSEAEAILRRYGYREGPPAKKP